MRFLTSLLCLSVTISVCMAHMCMLFPHQRGPMEGLDKEGSFDCFNTNAPCGAQPAGTAISAYKPGSNVTVVFQKNMDYYVSTTPGYFTIKLYSGNTFIQDLDRIEDRGEPSLYLYTSTSTLPTAVKIGSGYIIQVRYVTNNPAAPPEFYQCADILIAL